MGVFDFVKQGTEEMRLRRPADAHDPLVEFPERTLLVWAQLEVEPNEVAVFVRARRVIGLVGPGRHVVHPSKLAFLEGVETEKGRFPLSLVFVRLTPMEQAPFSAQLDPLSDPTALDAVRPLVVGELSLQVIDPIAFVEEHLEGGAHRPLLGRRGVVATIDGVRLTLDGRRVPVFAGKRFARQDERRPSSPPADSRPLACRGCGLMGEPGKFCAACGTLIAEREQCLACRAELARGARFCLSCGARAAGSGSR